MVDTRTCQVPLVETADVEMALSCTKPSTNLSHLVKYEKWHAKHGSGDSEEKGAVASSREGLPAAAKTKASQHSRAQEATAKVSS
jgi:hypothetical protein